MKEISINLGEITIAFDPSSPDKIKILLYLERSCQESDDCYSGTALISEIEEAIALFKSQSKSS